jgi:hypothetical protein
MITAASAMIARAPARKSWPALTARYKMSSPTGILLFFLLFPSFPQSLPSRRRGAEIRNRPARPDDAEKRRKPIFLYSPLPPADVALQ